MFPLPLEIAVSPPGAAALLGTGREVQEHQTVFEAPAHPARREILAALRFRAAGG